MKAILYHQYDGPNALKFEEVEKPAPKENQILIKVHAASINSYDWRHVRANPFLVRMGNGLLKPNDPRLGADIAGRVEAVGAGVTLFKPGDEVYGEVGTGGYAEYVCTSEKNLARKPATVSFEAAAATPMAALTALQGLRDKGQIQTGQKVLINGASGGVGTFAVQIAKYYGAEVTGVCRTRNVEMVRKIGADHVIDYTKEDFTKSGRKYDLIYDVAANRSVSAYRRVLAPQGQCVVAGFSNLFHLLQLVTVGAWVSKEGGQKIGMMGVARVDQDDLAFLAGLLESGKIVPVIDGCYPLTETAKAFKYYEEVHAQGKIIITMI